MIIKDIDGDELIIAKHHHPHRLWLIADQGGGDRTGVVLDVDGAVLLAQELATFLRANVQRDEVTK